mmetsp:Transcript_60317/g.168506  ORF Transcript_60317/g.168506 Transcript_60317/m.168506 type:complete len:272 (-) Transcript_60317:963-1778(-)
MVFLVAENARYHKNHNVHDVHDSSRNETHGRSFPCRYLLFPLHRLLIKHGLMNRLPQFSAPPDDQARDAAHDDHGEFGDEHAPQPCLKIDMEVVPVYIRWILGWSDLDFDRRKVLDLKQGKLFPTAAAFGLRVEVEPTRHYIVPTFDARLRVCGPTEYDHDDPRRFDLRLRADSHRLEFGLERLDFGVDLLRSVHVVLFFSLFLFLRKGVHLCLLHAVLRRVPPNDHLDNLNLLSQGVLLEPTADRRLVCGCLRQVFCHDSPIAWLQSTGV